MQISVSTATVAGRARAVAVPAPARLDGRAKIARLLQVAIQAVIHYLCPINIAFSAIRISANVKSTRHTVSLSTHLGRPSDKWIRSVVLLALPSTTCHCKIAHSCWSLVLSLKCNMCLPQGRQQNVSPSGPSWTHLCACTHPAITSTHRCAGGCGFIHSITPPFTLSAGNTYIITVTIGGVQPWSTST
jgi:hypothetical protein